MLRSAVLNRSQLSWQILILMLCCLPFNILAQSKPAEVKVDKHHLPNFYQVDENYWRGGQPTDDGIRELASMGVRIVVDLRGSDDDRSKHEAELVKSLGMEYVTLPISTVFAPKDEQVASFLKLVKTERNGPVFVHCLRGKDRTGLMTGLYRVSRYNWTPDQAYKEMKEFGYSLGFLRRDMKHYLYDYAAHKESKESEE